MKKIAKTWKVREFGNGERGISLFDEKEKDITGEDCIWEGHFYCYNNQLTTLDGAPQTIGGHFYCSHNQLTTLQGYPVADQIETQFKFLIDGYLLADGILEEIVSYKKQGQYEIFKTKKIGREVFGYCVYFNGKFSHGETIKQAITDLRYKFSSRDISPYREWDLKTKVPIDEMIQAYHAITGACSTGIKNFCESIELKDKYSVKEIIEITKDRYGHETFRDFFSAR